MLVRVLLMPLRSVQTLWAPSTNPPKKITSVSLIPGHTRLSSRTPPARLWSSRRRTASGAARQGKNRGLSLSRMQLSIPPSITMVVNKVGNEGVEWLGFLTVGIRENPFLDSLLIIRKR